MYNNQKILNGGRSRLDDGAIHITRVIYIKITTSQALYNILNLWAIESIAGERGAN